MPITFQSIDDPFGIRAGGSALGQALMQKNMERLQNQRQLEAEERQAQRMQEAEQRAMLQRQQNAGVLQNVMTAIADPNASYLDKIGAIQQYAIQTGDVKTATPLLNQIMKESERQAHTEADFNFLNQLRDENDIPAPKILPKGVSPGAVNTAFRMSQPMFEKESDKIEAKRSADYADKIVREYDAAETAETRLNQMKIAAKSGQLPTPLLVKSMDFLGMPLSVYANPLAESYEKLVNENIKNLSNYFPGQIRVAEIESYMKTIPTLYNSDEGKKIIVENQLLENQIKKAEYKAYTDLLSENKGKRPPHLDVKIKERTRGVRQEVAEKMKENMQKAIEITQFPTQRVNPGTPITPSQALNYMNKANGDRKKAEEMARKDGYEF